MSDTVRELQLVLLLLNVIPMIVVAVFVILTFYRLGYGPIGKLLSYGFIVLTVSLLIGFMNNLSGRTMPEVQLATSITRLVGWILLSIGFIKFFNEADRSLP